MRTRGGLEQLSAKPEPKREPAVKSESQSKAKIKKEESSGTAEDDAMTEYERKRLANIQRNLEFMKTMGVSTVRSIASTEASPALNNNIFYLIVGQDGGTHSDRPP